MWNLANVTEDVCLVVGRVNHQASVVVSTTIPTVSHRRTSGTITSAMRNVSASLIPGWLCVLILTASTEKYRDFWIESRAATGMFSRRHCSLYYLWWSQPWYHWQPHVVTNVLSKCSAPTTHAQLEQSASLKMAAGHATECNVSHAQWWVVCDLFHILRKCLKR